MNNMNFMKSIILSALLSLTILPCFSQEAVSIDIRQFREENDSLKISYVIKANTPAVASSQSLSITPMLAVGDSALLLPPVTIMGKNEEKVMARYRNNSGAEEPVPSIKGNDSNESVIHISIPYQIWMDSARISIRQEVSGYRGHNLVTHYHLNDRVELEAREPYTVQPQVAFIIPTKEEKRRKRQGKAYLDFPVGRSVIQPNYRRNPQELLKIDDAVREVINNPDAVLFGLYVEGFASPEGAYATNERLSRERATALKEYIRTKFSLNESLFRVTSVAEDWEGLETLVKASDLPEKDKILETISSVSIDAGREGALMKLNRGVPYRKMLKEMFPELRRVEYQIDYSVKDYGVDEAKKLLDRNPADLSQYELYNLAQSMEKGSRQYNSILLEIIPRQYPEDATANNNTAAAMIANGETATAKRHLEKAGDSPAALNNLGVIALLDGDLDKAEAYFDTAVRAGNKQARQNKKEVEEKRADNKKMERYKSRK